MLHTESRVAPLFEINAVGRDPVNIVDMQETKNNWPSDVDGDVFRRMEASGFDFDKEWTVDFNIDFDRWPISKEEEKEIERILPGCEFFDPDEEDSDEGSSIGYVLTKERAIVTYDFVMDKQKELTKKMKPFGGWCESWGVLH